MLTTDLEYYFRDKQVPLSRADIFRVSRGLTDMVEALKVRYKGKDKIVNDAIAGYEETWLYINKIISEQFN